MSGIYSITNLVNNKRYIGQSVNISKRWQTHKYELRGGYHDNAYLQSSWNKYGEENFIFEVLEYCSPEDLDYMEGYFIWLYDTLDEEHGYNLTSGGKSNRTYSERGLIRYKEVRKTYMPTWLNTPEANAKKALAKIGTHPSEETRQKLSLSHKGKKLSQETRAKMSASRGRAVQQYTTDGVFVAQYSSMVEAYEQTGINRAHINSVCLGNRLTAGGYFWKYI
ncbi:MAG: GIY-YIG nuclease family protein [Paludibacteraceae bacterium]|nr:GIY-YIG nuclease family protein [Paludibacteraceae bacterium]